jgi:hypothetical protein
VSEAREVAGDVSGVDIGEFCRRVEEHLARVNDGQIVRVFGPAFELVRSWALEGIPFSVVSHGIDLKAERHRAGRSKRPLRLEFCEADVREVFAGWRRSVGLMGQTTGGDPSAEPSDDSTRRPSLSRHLDRAIERLSSATGRLEFPEAFRDRLSHFLDELVDLREAVRGARGAGRAELAARLPDLDARLLDAGRGAVSREELEAFQTEAAADLAAFRSRLSHDAWQRSVDLGAERLIRTHLGLPTLTFET